MRLARILVAITFTLLSAATLRAATVDALVYSVSGTVRYADPGSSKYQPLKKGQHLAVGTSIRTEEDGTAVLVTTVGSAIQIGNDSDIKINDLAFAQSGSNVTERKANLTLNSGVVSALINPGTPKITDFKIQTPQGAAAARGTFFAVLVWHGKTYIGVKEGKVAATSH